MFVRAHAASNCRAGASVWARNSTSLENVVINKLYIMIHLGRMPRLIMTSMGGFLSRERIFLADWVAWGAKGFNLNSQRTRFSNLQLFVRISASDAVLDLLDREQGRGLLVVLLNMC